MKLICGIRTVGMNPKTRKEDKVHAHVYLFLFSLCFLIDYMFIFLMFFFSSYSFLALAYLLVIGGNPTSLQSILVCINYCGYMYFLKIKAKLYTFNCRNEGIVVTYLSATLL